MTQSGVAVTGSGQLKGIIVNSHSSGTIAVNDGLTGTAAGVKATAKLVLTGAIVPATHANATLTSSGACVPASHAESVVTVNTVADGTKVIIGDVIYTARTTGENATFANLAYEIPFTTDADFLDN